MEFPNRQERQHLLFMSAAEKIKSLGYEVYASVLKNETIDKAHYGHFVKDNRIGYFQADLLGFVIEFTTVYKPSAKHGCGEKIEENFFFVKGYNKRFFTVEDAERFFSIVGKPKVKEEDMARFNQPKKVIEVQVEKE